MSKPKRHVLFGVHVVNADEAEQYWMELESTLQSAKDGLAADGRLLAKLEAENKRLRDSIEMLDTLPSPNTDRVAQLKAERDELAAALRDMLGVAPSSSDMRILIIALGGNGPVARNAMDRFDKIDTVADVARAALAKVGTTQKEGTDG